MEKLIKKLSEYYSLEHMRYTYKIEHSLTVLSCAFANVIGFILIIAPIVNTPINQWEKVNLDNCVGVLLFCFFYYGLSSIFFMHNKSKIGVILLTLGYSAFGLVVVITIGNLGYSVFQWHVKGYSNLVENLDVFYFDLFLIVITTLIYCLRSRSFKAFLDKTFSRY